ncbi:hypothetical protein OEZ85_012971 [Tetradesmus obliquus]|uniref:Uncharacterized protein n=1 Tax=Tetradesmus obliquus TaxID=3088 RepID=A0ABY8U4Y0_TETOB|nr:hypothetical protein OEZ85_012971 [Tetradesmus obliquus]
MQRTNCLQRLVLSGCSIEAAGAGVLLAEVLHPAWPCQLRWLDLSHNTQLVLAGDEPELGWLLLAAGRLQGLCLQHTGLTGAGELWGLSRQQQKEVTP